MAQEGISTLPQAPTNAMPSFDVALQESKQALSQQFPGAEPEYDQGIEQLVAELNLAPDELQTLKQILELLLSDEAQYPQLRQRLINEAGVRPEDIPEEFDRGYLTTMLIVVQEAIKRSGGMAQGTQMPQPQGFRQGGLAEAAEALRQKGRGGDTILAHINPQEASLLKAMGGSGTINPATGLMEFKGGNPLKAVGKAFSSVGNAVKKAVSSPVGRIIGTVALTVALGPAGLGMSTALAAGVAGAGISLAGGSNLKQALISGVTSGAMAWAAPGISKMLPGAGGYLNAAATGAIMGAGYGAATGQNIAKSALTGGVLAGGMSAAGGASATGPGTSPGIFSTEPKTPAPVTDYSQPLTPPTEGISSLPGGQTNVSAPSPFTAQTETGLSTLPGENVAPPTSNVNNYLPGNANTELTVTNKPLTGTQTAPGTQTAAGPQPAPGGPMDYLTKAKDYLFSSDPKNPGFFYNDKGQISIPAVTGTVLAAGYLGGGFKTNQPPAPGMVNPSVTGETLVSQNPDKYVVSNLPGYNAPQTPPYVGNMAQTPMYGLPAQSTPYNPYAPVRFAAKGGISDIYPRKTGKIDGPGTGTSDSIPAMLSDGEFVLTAKAVRGAGAGSRREGAKKLYRMMHALEKKAGGKI
jgi:hypothetical protein